MKMEAVSHQGIACGQVGHKSRDNISDTDSGRQVQRYIRLTYLIPEFLEKMDKGEIALSVGVELSYLNESRQQDVLEQCKVNDCTPSYSQAWRMNKAEREPFVKQAEDTLIPDLISIVNTDGDYQFIIFDAKYYNIQLEHNKKLRGQPGIESITKQYLYQLAYRPFVEAHQIRTVRNCFLMPTAGSEITEKGVVSLGMLQSLGLQNIQIRLLPASTMYKHYVDNTKFNLQSLNL